MVDEYDVLVVDDEQVVIDAVRKVLTGEGLTVDEAAEAEAALRKIEQGKHKMVIVDLMMPKVSGSRLLQTIVKSYPEMPVVLTTGSATGENAVQMLKLGAFDFLPKPFTMDELTSVVHRALRFAAAWNASNDRSGPDGRPGNGAGASLRDIYHLGDLTWTVAEPGGTAIIGLADLFQSEVGPIEGVDLPPVNETIHQGGPLGRISARDSLVHLALAPISGRIVEQNAIAINNPTVINEDPYGLGWLLRIRPFDLENELLSLVARPGQTGRM